MGIRKKPIDYIKKPFAILVSSEISIGILLFAAALAAMIMANSGLAHWYHELWEKEITISFDDEVFSLTLHHFINDGLMAIFFFLVGLEIKREFLAGELSHWRKSSLPIAAAIGGMAVPALVYVFFNDVETRHGWGIPMATDIAFVLGLINLVRTRINVSVKVFVTSLAVVDDIGAVLVIAFFYTSSLHVEQLYIAGGTFLLLLAANRMGVRNVFFYSFVGIGGIWVSFFYSGIHPSIAGILLAFTIPSRYRINKEQFNDKLKVLYRQLRSTEAGEMGLNSPRQDHLLQSIRVAGDEARAPLQKIEHGLHSFVYFIVMPLFAFANAGLTIHGNIWGLLTGSIGLGIVGGLLVGKFLGITLMSRLMVAVGIARLPAGATWKQIYGASILAGIGFTMSLFIAELAFARPEYVEAAKSAILFASIMAAVIGLVVIILTNPKIHKATDV